MTIKTNPLLIALHGWGARGGFFAGLKAALVPEWDILAPDLMGHGALQDADPVSLDLLAQQVADIVDAQNGRPVILLGWSMGAAAAMRYLKQFGTSKICGLLIEDMSPKPLNDPDWQCGIRSGYSAKDLAETDSHIRAGWQRYGKRVWRATFADLDVAKHFESDPLFADFLDNREEPLAQAWASLMGLDARAFISETDLPLLAIMGSQSHVYGPELSGWYEANLRNGSVVRLEGAGHAPHLECPEIFADLVSGFMQKHC